MTIKSEIKQDKMTVFRRLYMKRRLAGGEYETTWQRIPDRYIKRWGTISYSIDDVVPNFVKLGDFSFSVNNDDGFFSDVSEEKSFFYTAITRYRTLIKVEAGYTASDGTEYPTDPSLFVGIITQDAKYKQDNIVSFRAKALSQIFEEMPADQIVGMGAAQTVDGFIVNIRDHKQTTTGDAIFQKYISSTNWNYSTGSNTYNLATSTSLQNKTCWKLLQDLAGAEQKVVYVDRFGHFYFYPRTVAGTATYHFSGIGDENKEFGHNILSTIQVNENVRKVYNRVVVDYASSSRYIKQENWDWGDSSSSFYYGVQEFKYSNKFINDLSVATVVGDGIYDTFVRPKDEISFQAKFVPHLNPDDRVSITYKTQRFEGGSLWDVAEWNTAVWGERLGYNIRLDSVTTRIIELKHDINSFKTSLKLREI